MFQFVMAFDWHIEPSGFMEFDYVSSSRPPLSAEPLDEEEVTRYVQEVSDLLEAGRLQEGAFVRFNVYSSLFTSKRRQ